MCFESVIVILKKKNFKQKDLTDYLGIHPNNFTEWKSGRSESWKKYLPQIAEFLGVTVDELLGAPSGPVVYDPARRRVADLLSRLDDTDLLRVEGMIQMLLQDEKYKKDARPDAL